MLLRFVGKDIQNMRLEDWLDLKPKELQTIATRWLDAIKKCGNDVEIILHDNYPIGCVDNAPFAYVNVYTSHVNVGFFYGTELPSKSGLLEGTGKRMRHIKLKPNLKSEDEAILSLISESYQDIKKRISYDKKSLSSKPVRKLQ